MTTTISPPHLLTQNLSFAYGPVQALADVSFSASPGEIIAIVGPNGCGKSTLLRVIIGDLYPSHGTVSLQGASVRDLPVRELARRVALVPQQVATSFGYSVEQTVLMARHAAHAAQGTRLFPFEFETQDDLNLAQRAMWDADVHHLAQRPLTALSGGERQRVAIARAFTQNTPILLLDEPTAFLDLFHQLELMHQLRALAHEQQRLILFVTHDLNLAAAHATRVIVMDSGRIVADGPPDRALDAGVLESVYRVRVSRSGGHGEPGGGERSGVALYFSRRERDNGGSEK